jgi:6-pyruvoyltetrahydropterin/6-carboxytetrahydropterin synthase
MSYAIAKSFTFDASHRLDGLPEGHKCAQLHGHTYRVEVTIEAAKLDAVGMILDYGRLVPFRRWIDATLDHHHLNDAVAVNPTAENLAAVLHAQLVDMLGAALTADMAVSVAVSETANTWARYAP